MLELTDTHSLLDTEVPYTVPSFCVNTVVLALRRPVSISFDRDLKSSFARMTFLNEVDFCQRMQTTNQSREPSVSHPDKYLDDTSLFLAPQR